MSGEGEQAGAEVRLPDELVGWLDDHAESDRDRSRLVADLVAAYRAAVEGEGDTPSPAELERRLVDQREEYTEMVTDLRDRVIQMRREVDGAAPADHDHPELSAAVDYLQSEHDATRSDLTDLEQGVENVRTSLSAVQDDLASLEEDVGDVEEKLQSGFQNYRDVVERLTEAIEDAEADVDGLAGTVEDLRTATAEVTAAQTDRMRADRLKRAANREGVRTADCGDCGESVDVALLSTPACPHCETPFSGVEPAGLVGADRLVPGDPPEVPGVPDDLGESTASATTADPGDGDSDDDPTEGTSGSISTPDPGDVSLPDDGDST